MGGLRDYLRVPREGIWEVSLFLTLLSLRIVFSEGILCQKVVQSEAKEVHCNGEVSSK